MCAKRKKNNRYRRLNIGDPQRIIAAIESGYSNTVILNENHLSLNNIRRRLLTKRNTGEAIASRLLDEAGISYVREKMFFHKNKPFFMDFFVTVDGRNIAVEVDGGIHNLPEVIERDKIKDEAYMHVRRLDGVLRIKVRQIKLLNSVEFVNMIRSCKKKQITLCPLNMEARPRGKKADRKP